MFGWSQVFELQFLLIINCNGWNYREGRTTAPPKCAYMRVRVQEEHSGSGNLWACTALELVHLDRS